MAPASHGTGMNERPTTASVDSSPKQPLPSFPAAQSLSHFTPPTTATTSPIATTASTVGTAVLVVQVSGLPGCGSFGGPLTEKNEHAVSERTRAALCMTPIISAAPAHPTWVPRD